MRTALVSVRSWTEDDREGGENDEILLDPARFVQRSQWIPHSVRKQCHVCARDFTLWRKKHTCRMCGDVVCGRCSMHKRVDLPLIENKFRVCSCCFFVYRQGYLIKPPQAIPCVDNQVNLEWNCSEKVCFDPLMDPTDSKSVESNGLFDSSRQYYDNSMMTLDEIMDAEDAALNARELELEAQVQASRLRVEELEAKIAQEQSKHDLTLRQQHELQEAQKLITQLTRQLKMQEEQVQMRATFRESLVYEDVHRTRRHSGVIQQQRIKEDLQLSNDTAKLRRQLKKMERQLKQAGINVAEDIPYDEAREKVDEISKRLQEIGSSEVVCDDKAKQAELRREYFRLEQEMEKYNTALMMTDEYLEAEREKERQWHLKNKDENVACLLQLRQCIPVNISVLTERELGDILGTELAKKLKRTNVLQLVRTDPKTIQRMHPSVIEAYRLTGLSVLERRALENVLSEPAAEWKKQSNDELSARKYAWYKKLHDTLLQAIQQLELHENHNGQVCQRRSQCPVLLELKARALYTPLDTPFSQDAIYYVQDVIKSDPDGAGEKALAQVRQGAVIDARQKQVKAHYGSNLREVTLAMGAMDDLDTALTKLKGADQEMGTQLDSIDLDTWITPLHECKDMVLSMAKRSGLHLSGKRDSAKDANDTRAQVEVMLSVDVLLYIEKMVQEMELFLNQVPASSSRTRIVALIKAIKQGVREVQERNHCAVPGYRGVAMRKSWSTIAKAAVDIPPTVPVSAPSFLDELKSKPSMPIAPLDMLAAIKARRNSRSNVADVANSA